MIGEREHWMINIVDRAVHTVIFGAECCEEDGSLGRGSLKRSRYFDQRGNTRGIIVRAIPNVVRVICGSLTSRIALARAPLTIVVSSNNYDLAFLDRIRTLDHSKYVSRCHYLPWFSRMIRLEVEFLDVPLCSSWLKTDTSKLGGNIVSRLSFSRITTIATLELILCERKNVRS